MCQVFNTCPLLLMQPDSCYTIQCWSEQVESNSITIDGVLLRSKAGGRAALCQVLLQKLILKVGATTAELGATQQSEVSWCGLIRESTFGCPGAAWLETGALSHSLSLFPLLLKTKLRPVQFICLDTSAQLHLLHMGWEEGVAKEEAAEDSHPFPVSS